ncbi:unnamed protein product [Spirodela intermedia]|uniref:Transketolase-like pyrimidine-binding domain-containing protein n=1 Tax=Spirodela intermedia TaxID=51605 RepID=A0A7I8IVV3_SPIIN|nr:unnamed protein product [Spirodela intermedia]CAA6661772.1 unnamed protein product [Spirodela intermedia]
MAWFRAVSGVARHAVRKNLIQASHHVTRPASVRCPPAASVQLLPGTTPPRFPALCRFQSSQIVSSMARAACTLRSSRGRGKPIQQREYALAVAREGIPSKWAHDGQTGSLGLEEREVPVDLDPAFYGFTDEDLDREFFIGVWRMSGFLSDNRPVQTLRSILNRLQQAYCGSVGYEYMHIADRDQCNWLRDQIETVKPRAYGRDRQEVILDRLIWSTQFENFLATKWVTAKRFGLEGAETLIPGMKEMFDRASDLGVESIVVGMPHRGRLNVLGNVFRKPLRQIFSEFSGSGTKAVEEVGSYTGTGDVKYHLGKRIHLSLVANPSHLEAVDPVVLGKIRGKQYYSNDIDRTKNLAVLIHGDGSFAGQGVVYETLHLSALPNYTTGGTIHIVVNNQVAFTTDPTAGRSSQYCTDVAKALDAPIFHVNGDDMEAVVHDVVVDVVCYRRFGHNEMDEPSFTQPKMYQVIRSHPSALHIYQNKLLESGSIKKESIDSINSKVNSILNEEFNSSKDYIPKRRDWLSAYWTGFKSPEQISRVRNTGVKPEILKRVGEAITTLPENFKAHKVLKRIFEERYQMIQTGEGVDWALGEALAFATLLVEGNHVRLSGQDVERGTFSHRHSVIHDQETGEIYCPLDHVMINQNEEMFTVSNSSLSEFGVLGFELGYSMENPNSLILWEAQFGDFANGAQVIFDQFLSSGESKWLRQTGLVVLLPMGTMAKVLSTPPQDSSVFCRYLPTSCSFWFMSDDNPYVIPEMDPTMRKQIQECNWQVVNVTTPANYFHVLRRQIHREFRKPLIVMSPKNLLRHPKCKSNLSEFDDVQGHPGFDKQGTRFKRLIKDQNDHSDLEEGIRRLVLCSGKVYYDLDEERRTADAKDVAICRVEQLCPFPYDLVQRELKRYPNAEVVWCQEEPMNMGAYNYISPRLCTAIRELGRGPVEVTKYVGRPPSAATATGFLGIHQKEQKELVQKAIGPDPVQFPL